MDTTCGFLISVLIISNDGTPGVSTDPPRPPKAPPKQSPGKKKEIITKHDSTVCGRRNVKIMEKVIFFIER